MASKNVDIVDPQTGHRTRIAETSFRKVWADRGWVLAEDYDREEAPQDEASLNAEGGANSSAAVQTADGDASKGTSATGASAQQPGVQQPSGKPVGETSAGDSTQK